MKEKIMMALFCIFLIVFSSVNVSAFGASSYFWSPAIGLSSTTANSVIANPQSTIDYTISGTDANNCTNSANLHIDVGNP